MDALIDVSDIKIETRRLILRPFSQADLADFNQYAQVPGVGEMAGWKHHESIEESQCILNMFINEKKTLAMVDKATLRVIGSIGLEKTSQELGDTFLSLRGRDIGYVLAQDYWGQGRMAEAVQAVIDNVFNVLDFDFLSCAYFLYNHQSERITQKCGFTQVKQIDYITRMNTVERSNLTVLMNPNRTRYLSRG